MKKNITSAAGLCGVYRFTECDCSSEAAKLFSQKIEKAIETGSENIRAMLDEFVKKFQTRTWEKKNLVTTAGLAATAQFWVDTPGSVTAENAPKITYAAVGTGTALPTSSNTQLNAEVYRSVISSQSRTDGKVFNTFFLGLGHANGNTISECGLFAGNADATSGSGLLMSHVLVSPNFEKIDETTLVIDISHTFTSA